MRMEVFGTDIQRKKALQALSVIFGAVSEDFLIQLDPKKSAKENWETL